MAIPLGRTVAFAGAVFVLGALAPPEEAVARALFAGIAARPSALVRASKSVAVLSLERMVVDAYGVS